jgi:membrane protein insertase Oxa1/YidC/SpoIIIJ
LDAEPTRGNLNEKVTSEIEEVKSKAGVHANVVEPQDDERMAAQRKAKMNDMSGLSIILTVMSILVAFRYRIFSLQFDFDLV